MDSMLTKNPGQSSPGQNRPTQPTTSHAPPKHDLVDVRKHYTTQRLGSAQHADPPLHPSPPQLASGLTQALAALSQLLRKAPTDDVRTLLYLVEEELCARRLAARNACRPNRAAVFDLAGEGIARARALLLEATWGEGGYVQLKATECIDGGSTALFERPTLAPALKGGQHAPVVTP